MEKLKKHFFLNYRLLKLAWEEEKKLLFLYFFTSALGSILIFVVYYLYKLMIEEVFNQLTLHQNQMIFFIVAGYLFTEYLSRFVYYTINSYFLEYTLRSKFQNLLTRKFTEKLANLDFAHLENGEIRNLIAKVEDTFTWRLHDNLRIVSYLIYNFSALFLSLIIALKFNLIYFILLAIFSAPFYYLRMKYGNAYWSIYSSHARDTNYLWYLRHLFTNFQTLFEIKIYQLKDFFLKKMLQTQEKLIKEYVKPIKKYTFWSIFTNLLIPLVIFLAIKNFIGTVFIKKFSIGDFTLFLNTLFTFSGQLSNILLNFGSLYENDLFADDYFKLLDIKNKNEKDEKDNEKKIVLSDGFQSIKFINVSFFYPHGEKLALKNIDLTIKKGENIALVGRNGAGKTTLIKLLLGFYPPTEGRILINDIDLKKINLHWWWEQVGILFQDFAKYYLTLKENIYFGQIKKIDDHKVIDVLKKAQGKDLLKSKKALNQILGRWFEEGEEISVGQWQKVAIARALYRDAPLLILDEPTSNIDPESEEKIFENLVDLYREKTLVFISHRFSTVRKADKIFVIDQGEIIEQGSHEQLLKLNGLYAQFFKTQKKGYQ